MNCSARMNIQRNCSVGHKATNKLICAVNKNVKGNHEFLA